MENKFNKGIKNIQNIKMTTEEKKVLFERINIEIQSIEIKTEKKIVSPWNIHILGTWMHTSRLAFAVALALVITLTGGTLTYAAESSLPGDVLYPVKVKITEPIRDVLVANTEKDAQWQAEKAERRMKEAEILSTEGKLDSIKENEVNQLLTEHTQKLTKALDRLRKQHSEDVVNDISIKFQAGMNAHADVLDVINKNDASTSTKVVVSSVSKKAREDAKNIGDKISKSKSLRKNNKKSVESIIEKTSSDLNNIATDTTSFRKSIISNTRETLSQAKKLLKESDEQNNNGDSDKSSDSLLNSSHKAEEARIFMKRGFEVDKQMYSNNGKNSKNKN